MNVIAYKRVSTDDKGQDHSRQDAPLQAAAAREGHTIVAWVVDEGTSAGEKGMPTLDRPKVKEALALAKQHKAGGLLVESVDRWTRKGPNDLGYSMFVLERDYGGLKLLFADVPEDPFIRLILPALSAAMAFMDNKRKSDMARTAHAKKRARGERTGRMPKPDLSEEEWETIVVPMHGQGFGLRVIAEAVSRARRLAAGRDGQEVADPKSRREHSISEPWLRAQVVKRETTNRVLSRVYRSHYLHLRQNAAIVSQAEEARRLGVRSAGWVGTTEATG